MYQLNNILRKFVYPFLLIILMGMALSVVFYFVLAGLADYDVLTLRDHEKRLDGITKILGVSIAVTGFVSIIFSIIQSRESIQHSVDESVIELFRDLRSPEFIESRRRAWIIKEKWFQDDGVYKQKFLDYNFSTRKEKIKKDQKELDEDIKAVYQLIEFYLLVSSYKGSVRLMKQLRFFYYGWWRHFLYDFAHEIERTTKTSPKLQDPKSTYLRDISYTGTLERLDRLCGFQGMDRTLVLHEDGG